MTPRRRRLWVLLAASVVLILFVAAYRFVSGPRQPAVPAEILFPTNVSLAARVHAFESAYERHWAARRQRDADGALRELLSAIGVWTTWETAYGKDGASARLVAYRRALFHLFGEETWIVFGEWAAPGLEGTGEVGFLLFTRADSPTRFSNPASAPSPTSSSRATALSNATIAA
jgi:hypothetical protein